MRKQTKKIVIIGIGVFIMLLFIVGASSYYKYYQKDVRSHPEMYCYQTFYGPINPVMIIEDLDYKKEYVKFYDRVSQGQNPIFKFPLKTIPPRYPVYVMGYTKDSLLADIVSYYNRGVSYGGSYTRGWVYAKTLHENPPQMPHESH